MVDMAKLKEDALKRKQEHEEKELKRQMQKQRPTASRKRSGGASRNAQRNGRTQAVQTQPQKKKRSVSRWVLDILLVLGALLVMLMFINPF